MENLERKEYGNGMKFLVLLFSFLAVVMGGANVTSLAILLPSWTTEFGMTESQYAALAGAFSLGGVISCWLVSSLLDKFKPKLVYGIAYMIAGVTIILRGSIANFETAYVILILSGIFGIICIPGATKICSGFFSAKRMHQINGVIISGGAVGYFIGLNGTIPWSAALGGWAQLFRIFGIAMIIYGVLVIIIIPHVKDSESKLNQSLDVDATNYTFWRKIKEIFTSKNIMLMVLAEFFIAGSIMSFTNMGPMVFLDAWDGITAEKAGFYISMSNIGSTIGYYLIPWLALRLKAKKGWYIGAAIWSMCLFFLSPFTGNAVLTCIMINLAGFANGFGLIGPRTMMLEDPDCAGVKAGTAMGLLLETNNLGQVVFPIIMAACIPFLGISKAWIFMGALGLIGVILLAFGDEGGKKARAKAAAKNAA